MQVAHSTEIKRLQLTGHILPSSLEISDTGKKVLAEITAFYTRTTKDIMDSLGDDFTDNLLKYRELFPKGSQSGRTLRSSVNDIAPRMKWFMSVYPQYTWENILTATEKYINSLKDSNKLEYCKTASYFIKKDDKNRLTVSSLAEWCEAETDGDNEEDNPIAVFNKLI